MGVSFFFFFLATRARLWYTGGDYYRSWLLPCFTASLLHCFTASLLHCFASSQLHFNFKQIISHFKWVYTNWGRNMSSNVTILTMHPTGGVCLSWQDVISRQNCGSFKDQCSSFDFSYNLCYLVFSFTTQVLKLKFFCQVKQWSVWNLQMIEFSFPFYDIALVKLLVYITFPQCWFTIYLLNSFPQKDHL